VVEWSLQTAQAGKRLERASSAALPKRGAIGAPDHQACDRPPRLLERVHAICPIHGVQVGSCKSDASS